jgi:hypothetical protein
MAKNISIPTTRNTEVMAMSPGIAGYVWFQKGGKHGSVKDM